jgi:DNA-binding response OmpR family regulator
MGARILVVDDDRIFLRSLQANLAGEGYEVLSAADATAALRLTFEGQPDLVILDVMMPEVDGWEVCRRLRGFMDVPIIFLTALGAEGDIVRGLALGGDDYIVKPFSLAELKARIEATLRRTKGGTQRTVIFDDGALLVDLQRNIVCKRKRLISLSLKEFQLLARLVRDAGRVIPHAELLRDLWGPEYVEEISYLALYVRYLRCKIEDDPSNPHYIRTRFRVGYYFCPYEGSPVVDVEELPPPP